VPRVAAARISIAPSLIKAAAALAAARGDAGSYALSFLSGRGSGFARRAAVSINRQHNRLSTDRRTLGGVAQQTTAKQSIIGAVKSFAAPRWWRRAPRTARLAHSARKCAFAAGGFAFSFCRLRARLCTCAAQPSRARLARQTVRPAAASFRFSLLPHRSAHSLDSCLCRACHLATSVRTTLPFVSNRTPSKRDHRAWSGCYVRNVASSVWRRATNVASAARNAR